MAGPYSYLTRTSDTLLSTMAAGATSATLASGNFGTPTYKMVLTVDGDVPGKAADFECTVTGASLSSMVLKNGPDVEHVAGASVWCGLVDEGLDALRDGSGFSANAFMLDSDEITSTFSTTTVTTPVTVTGLSVTASAPTGGRPFRIEAGGYYMDKTTAGNVTLAIYEGAGRVAASLVTSPAGQPGLPAYVTRTFVPSAGSHTYNVAISQSNAGTVLLEAATDAPAYIRIYAA